MAVIEVFGDITCPFTHVGLKMIAREVHGEVEIHMRAWPLEWVNGAPLEPGAVASKVAALQSQLGGLDFDGFAPDEWPATSIPALNLGGAAAEASPELGLRVGLALRSALFEQGEDISDASVLARIASQHGLDAPPVDATEVVLADYEEGQRRGVRGSPDFWVGDDEFFCPSLDIGHDADGGITAHFDPSSIERFLTSAGLRR